MLENLPKAVLAPVVLTAVSGLFDFPALFRMWRVSRLDFFAAAIALGAVLLLGILQGILFAAFASMLMLLPVRRAPHEAYLGRIPGTNGYSGRLSPVVTPKEAEGRCREIQQVAERTAIRPRDG
jgi:SulP family sulfate permease